MPGQQVTRRRMAKLDEMGEEKVFEAYLEVGNVRDLTARLFEPHGGDGSPSHKSLYDWLHADEARWQRWQRVREMRGHYEADEALRLAMEATEGDVRSKKLKVDTLKWRASVLNREEYGNKVSHDVSGTVQHEWLEAMKASEEEEDEPEEIPEADVEIIEEGASN